MTLSLLTLFLTLDRDRFRSRRRASIAPLPALRLNSKEMLASDFDTHSLASNQASITSVNSLASLLREKMQVREREREGGRERDEIGLDCMREG